MKIRRLVDIPEKYKEEIYKGYEVYESESFSDRDLQFLKDLRIEAIYYWYGTRPYEGAGQMIFLKDGKWRLKDCGHCSCYGPVETGISGPHMTIEEFEPYDSPQALLENCSAELKKNVEPLIGMIGVYEMETQSLKGGD